MRIEIKLLLLITAMWTGCKADKTEQTQAQRLIETLKSVQAKGTLFGHQDDLAYGMKWSYIEGESDVKGSQEIILPCLDGNLAVWNVAI